MTNRTHSRVPLDRGGRHEIGNLWVVHHKVNIMKNTLMVEEFVEMCRAVAAYAGAID